MRFETRKKWLACASRRLRLLRALAATYGQQNRGLLTARQGNTIRRKLRRKVAVERVLSKLLRNILSIERIQAKYHALRTA